MLFAQTGTNSVLPIVPLEAEVNPYLIALWWIVPLAIAAIWIALIVISNKAKTKTRRRLNAEDVSKSKEPRKSAPSNEDATRVPSSTESSESRKIPTAGQIKKKKDKNKGKQKTKPPVPVELDSASLVQSETMASSAKGPESPASAASQAIAEPKPSNAIFEPLSDASKGRRKAFANEIFNSRESREDSSPRENDAYDQLYGGKFERIIPRQSLRSVANRWPTADTQPTKSSAVVVSRSTPAAPAVAPDSIAQSLPETPAPVKGLASFVSKVKSSPDPELQSTETQSTSQIDDQP